VHFTQRAASEAAQALMSLPVCTKEEKAALANALERVKFNSPYGKDMKRWLRHGIGVHHAGLLPKYRILVESLAQQGLLKLICGTDTLGVGINVPIRTVLFTQLWKYDGRKAAILSVRDFRQIAGTGRPQGHDDPRLRRRAGAGACHREQARRGKGRGRSDAEEETRQGARARGLSRLGRARPSSACGPPARGAASRFDVSHGMLLLVLSRDADGCRAMRQLIATATRPPPQEARPAQARLAALPRAARPKIVEVLPGPSPHAASLVDARGRAPGAPLTPKLRVNVELQDDFSLHQALSLYLIDTLPLLNRESPDYPFDVLTLCEAIVEDPDQILRRQVDRLKTEKIEEMRAAGIEYDERMEKLEEVEHPKPLREFLYETFNAFAAAHPWVDQENVRPKSIAREMFERYQSFADYIREYGSSAARASCCATCPGVEGARANRAGFAARRPRVVGDGGLLPRTDPRHRLQPARGVGAAAESGFCRGSKRRRTSPRGRRATTSPAMTPPFRRLVRTAIFGFLQDVAARDWEAAAERVAVAGDASPGSELTGARRIEREFAAYFEARGRFRLDPEGRAVKHTHIQEQGAGGMEPGVWQIAQVLVDVDGQNDWEARFELSLTESRQESRPVLRFLATRPVSAE
jgi:hypothetical protein